MQKNSSHLAGKLYLVPTLLFDFTGHVHAGLYLVEGTRRSGGAAILCGAVKRFGGYCEVDGGLLEYEASGVYLERKRSLAVDRSYPNLNGYTGVQITYSLCTRRRQADLVGRSILNIWTRA